MPFICLNLFLLFIPNQETQLNIQLLGIFITTVIAFIMGFADDAYNTQPMIKFMSQVICGLVLSFTGHSIQITQHPTLNYLLTVFWVVFIMNAINLLDNMDGVVALVSLVICIFFTLISYQRYGLWNIEFLLSLGLIGSISGFLIYNFHPSKIFMGDSGSQFLGLILACFSIDLLLSTKINEIEFQWQNFFKQSIPAILLFIAPVSDTAIVFMKRISKGCSPFIGGRDHTTHALYSRGVKVGWVSILYAIITVLGGYLAYVIHTNSNSSMLSFAIIYFISVFTALFLLTLFHKQETHV